MRAFLSVFPEGFDDTTYLAWERDYKWEAHERWQEELGPITYKALLKDGDHSEIARRAVRIESRTNLLFSFEKMALRDAVTTTEGARTFAIALDRWLHGTSDRQQGFMRFVEAVESLPRKQTRVLTWPVVTVFGFIAQPERHIFLKPQVTKAAAERYGFPFTYRSRPNTDTYEEVLAFAAQVREDISELKPRDMIDIQSFIWVLGSPEYG